MKKGMELLAPAGDLKIFKSAIDAGADAIYFGGDLFGARASAKNFSLDEAKEALEYAHNRNKRAYLTVNTLLKNQEIEKDLYEYMKAYYKAGIDGVIIQDFGVFHFLKKFFPELELHASTQMNLSSKYGAKFLKDNGASRIVTARELSLKEIKEIHDEVGIEIEAFVHGALCVCYSGNCLMSSFIGGRSGNRGRCAQPCRLPYELCDSNKEVIADTKNYLLSPKDLWGIHDLNRMYEAGVYSLKIEGRLKNEAYVTNVVSVYRKYVDLLLDEGSKNYKVDKTDIQRLLDAGNRGGFTNRYFDYHNHKDMMDYENSSFVQKNKKPFHGNSPSLKKELYGEFIARVGSPITLNVWDNEGNVCELKEGIVEESKKNPTNKDQVEQKLSLAGDSSFKLSHITYDIDTGAFVPMKFVKKLRREALSYFEQPDAKEVNNYEEVLPLQNNCNKHIVIGVSDKTQFQAVMESRIASHIVLKDHLWLKDYNWVEEILSLDYDLCFSLPVVIRQINIPLIKEKVLKYKDKVRGFYVSSYDGLELLNELNIPKDKVFFDQRLYTFSNRSQEAFFSLGYKNFYAPLELNEKELSHRYNKTSELFVYGNVPLMYMANCVFQSVYPCKSNPETLLYLKDRKNAYFPVLNQCFQCTNIIFNSVPVCIFDEDCIKDLDMARIRLDFTFEDGNKTREILALFQSIYIDGLNKSIPMEYTRGHFRRGVS
ncbi:MAG: U32 family peptidase [Lachnospiraceae bacterium]|nr:U32 family peptidase [Lachnospiraceae bacterium]